jgi:hypothetical protein
MRRDELAHRSLADVDVKAVRVSLVRTALIMRDILCRCRENHLVDGRHLVRCHNLSNSAVKRQARQREDHVTTLLLETEGIRKDGR